MKIELHEITVRELSSGFIDKGEDGVFGFDDKLSIREPYQREFVYSEKEQISVINSVLNGFPIGVMYWMIKPDGTFGLLDGQQRTLSICHYIDGDYPVIIDGSPRFFLNLTSERQRQILDYKILVYFCDGTDEERLSWFRTINIAGKELTDQEIRNAVYVGPWITSAKKYFSKSGCYAYNLGGNYLRGNCIRQDYLETVLRWAADVEGVSIEEYMAKCQNYKAAILLKNYFTDVIDWVEKLFPDYDRSMYGVEWGLLFNRYRAKSYDLKSLRLQTKELLEDYEIQKKSGIYEYLLGGCKDEKLLNLRVFDERMKRRQYDIQKGICPLCGKKFLFREMHGDHIVSWAHGGKTEPDNLQMLCGPCNLKKSALDAKF